MFDAAFVSFQSGLAEAEGKKKLAKKDEEKKKPARKPSKYEGVSFAKLNLKSIVQTPKAMRIVDCHAISDILMSEPELKKTVDLVATPLDRPGRKTRAMYLAIFEEVAKIVGN